MGEAKGKINVYVCQKCGGHTVTINRDEGTTPFMLACRLAGVGCGGMANSSFYQVDQTQKPGWEWYRPDADELSKMDEDWQDHVRRGGLAIRQINGRK